MTWAKNGLLLAVGGLAGMALAAILDVSDKEAEKERDDVDALESLIENIRSDAEWAMEECVTDEDRVRGYARVNDSVREYQVELGELGKQIIDDLKKRASKTPSKEDVEKSIACRVQNLKFKMDNFD